MGAAALPLSGIILSWQSWKIALHAPLIGRVLIEYRYLPLIARRRKVVSTEVKGNDIAPLNIFVHTNCPLLQWDISIIMSGNGTDTLLVSQAELEGNLRYVLNVPSVDSLGELETILIGLVKKIMLTVAVEFWLSSVNIRPFLNLGSDITQYSIVQRLN
ncbi:hypothetical protein DFJ77DRAFT_473289 [Powellomyces hirtus]|nr:hypothetical protein DFJ77DRAFT_473289 [Powellomyces hirtus]